MQRLGQSSAGQASRGWFIIEIPDERSKVELPFIAQLKALGWKHIDGDVDVPYLTERESFRDVLLLGRLRDAVRRINVDEEGEPWLDNARVNEAVGQLERLGTHKLIEPNQTATELLLEGVSVEGDPARWGRRCSSRAWSRAAPRSGTPSDDAMGWRCSRAGFSREFQASAMESRVA